jgi:hypothetical protein
MKNPLPLPAAIAAIVVVVLIAVGATFHFIQGQQPIYLERKAGGTKGKFANLKSATPPAGAPPAKEPAKPSSSPG